MGGAAATTVLEGDGRQFDVAVRYPPEYRDSIEKIRNVKVAYQTGSGTNAYIPLSELATISLDTGAVLDLSRERAALYPGQVQRAGARLGQHRCRGPGAHSEKRETAAGIPAYLGRRIRGLQEAKKRLEIIVPISLALILGLLYAAFNSLRDSLLDSRRHSFRSCRRHSGAFISGLNFSISAAVGFVSLFGVSVMNGILMITYYNQEGSRGARQRRRVSRRVHAHAAAPHDGPFRLHRPSSRSPVDRHRKRGAASPCHCDRWRHARRPYHAPFRAAGAADGYCHEKRMKREHRKPGVREGTLYMEHSDRA